MTLNLFKTVVTLLKETCMNKIYLQVAILQLLDYIN